MTENNPGLMTLFNEALERTDPALRAAYLDRVCGHDAELRRRLEELLNAHQAAGRFLLPDPQQTIDRTGTFQAENQTGEHAYSDSTDTYRTPTTRTERTTTNELGTVIAGRYTLVEVIGEGGMGSVYLAEQSEPVKRKVALKLIKTGMDSRGVLARFDAERQALALMDHPNIARIYDGGLTPTGQPFFVMELVKGVPLTDYCDTKRLTVEARLQLFVAVCNAVQHAHQKGIIHRDLKPGNVLVTEVDGRPTPKVIDFGVAKATEQQLTDISFSDTGAIVGTPAYMSPEQADPSSMDIDTRSDVYALGVILYELLTGSPPIDSKQFKRGALLEMLRMVREVEPPRPSTKLSTADALPNIAANRSIEPAKLAKLLRGELDWIVLKALEKDRTRRYDTANGLARDVQRYLTDEVVEARPPSWGYRLKKFVKRNKVQVVAASVIAVTLVLGIVGTTFGLIEAKKQEAEAFTQAGLAREETQEKEKARLDEAREKALAQELAKKNADLAKQEQAARQEKEVELNRSRESLMTAQLQRANAIRDADPDEAYRLLYELDRCPIELRDAAWRFTQNHLSRRKIATLPTGSIVQPGSPSHLVHALHPEGTEAAIITTKPDPKSDGKTSKMAVVTVAIPSGNTIRSLNVELDGCQDLAYSPDGRLLAIVVNRVDQFRTRPKPTNVVIWNLAENREQAQLTGHTDFIYKIAFSPDGLQLATASKDKTAKLWNPSTGQLLHNLPGHDSEVRCVRFHPSRSQVATGGMDNTARLWDTATGKPLNTWKASKNETAEFNQGRAERIANPREIDPSQMTDGVIALDISPDGQTLALGNLNWQTELLDLQSGRTKQLFRGMTAPVQDVYFHPNGTSLFTGALFQPTKRWSLATGQLLLTMPRSSAIRFSKSGHRMIHTVTGAMEVLNVDTPAESMRTVLKQAPFVSDAVPEARFSGDGSVLAVVRDQVIDLYDPATMERRRTLNGHTRSISHIAVAPDGRTLISSSGLMPTMNPKAQPKEPPKSDLRIWNMLTGEALGQIEVEEELITALAISPNGSTMATLSTKIKPGSGLPSGSCRVCLWDVATKKRLTVLDDRGPAELLMFGQCCFSPDGQQLAVGLVQGIFIWNLTSRTLQQQFKLEGPLNFPRAMSYTLDGQSLLIYSGGFRDRHLDRFNSQTGQREARWRRDTISFTSFGGETSSGIPGLSLAISPDGKSVATAERGVGVRLWNLTTGQLRAEITVSSPHAVEALVFDPTGRSLWGLGNYSPKTGPKEVVVQSWDIAPSSVVAIFGPSRFNFSADSKTLILKNEETQFWDLEQQRIRLKLKTFPPAGRIAFNRVNRIMVVGSSTGTRDEQVLEANGMILNQDKIKGVLEYYNQDSGQLVQRVEHGKGHLIVLDSSADATRLAFVQYHQGPNSLTSVLTTWDVATNQPIATWSTPTTKRITAIKLTTDGSHVVVGSTNREIDIIDATTGQVVRTFKAPSTPTNFRFSPDGTRLYVELFQRNPKYTPSSVWDWRTGQTIEEQVPPHRISQAFSPDGRFEMESDSAGMRLIDHQLPKTIPRSR